MRLGTYILSGLIFIAFAAAAAYMLNPAYYAVTVMGVTLSLPVAAWIALPLLLLFFLTILHMLYHGTRGYFANRRWSRDADELKDALYWSLLKEPKEHHFSVPQIKEGAALLNVSALEVNGTVQGLSDKLNKALEWVKAIEQGEYVDLKAKKIAKFLSKDNPLVVRNLFNRLDAEKEFAETVVQDHESYPEKLVQEAMDRLVGHADLFKLKKYAPLMSRAHLERLLERVEAGEEIGFSREMMEAFIPYYARDCRDFVRLARLALKRFTPDETLALFKKLAKENEKAQNAYLYLLFEYEMLDSVKSFLEEHDEHEFKPFRAFYILKRGKYHFKIDELIDTHIACNEA